MTSLIARFQESARHGAHCLVRREKGAGPLARSRPPFVDLMCDGYGSLPVIVMYGPLNPTNCTV